ncbi:hypothetical protein [Enterococcus ureasiticus]|uniref:Butirosin biosynthesis protein H N-terminal domain-containing protein n=1 Tax=Enterococcus ureasiticus TaxID=903984 RepID=A0A1E5GDL3_9ENTE|nr:hypothetical protein [Enterococcus ureasiticus]OEG10340.1 hypothetical protein BCR21_13405 [Enterococcus ureasiticus]
MKKSYECLNSSLVFSLNSLGIIINPSDLYIIGEGYDFCYSSNYLGANQKKNSYLALNRLDIYFNEFRVSKSNFKNFISYMSTKSTYSLIIKVSSIIICCYSNIKKISDNTHYINIVGISEDKKKIFIHDGFIPDLQHSTFVGWIDIEVLFSNSSEILTGLLISKPSHKIDVNKLTVEMFPKVISKLVKNPLTIKHLKNYLEINSLTNLNYDLRFYGFIASRKFIRDYYATLYYKEFYIDKADEIIKAWDAFCLFILKMSIRDNKNLSLILSKYTPVLEKESKLLNKIYNISKGSEG